MSSCTLKAPLAFGSIARDNRLLMTAVLGGGAWCLATTGLDGICVGCAGFGSLAAGGGAAALAGVLHAVVGLGLEPGLWLVLPGRSGGLWNKVRGTIFQGS